MSCLRLVHSYDHCDCLPLSTPAHVARVLLALHGCCKWGGLGSLSRSLVQFSKLGMGCCSPMLYGVTQEGLVGDDFREGCILLYVGGGEGCRQERRNCIVCGVIGRCETH